MVLETFRPALRQREFLTVSTSSFPRARRLATSPRPVMPNAFMLIAGEPSGDLLAAELVRCLRTEHAACGLPEPTFFGAGGPAMAAEGVRLELDLTRYAIIGLADVLRNLWRLRDILDRMVRLALERRPAAVICVDYGGFNRRFAAAIRARQPADWRPRLIQYVSPQVWASRPGRATTLARDLDLLLAILPHEKAWYASRYPGFRVEFVGHPIVDRHPTAVGHSPTPRTPPRIVLLPGSRPSEIARHWVLMAEAAACIQAECPSDWVAVFPNDAIRKQALALHDGRALTLQATIGGLSEELARATLAIASTGTVTLECALWKVPTIAIYRASWSTYQIARRIIRVRHLALPNLLADEPVMPELIQNRARPEIIAREACRLLAAPAECDRIRQRLGEMVSRLGPPGAPARAARAVLALLAGQGR